MKPNKVVGLAFALLAPLVCLNARAQDARIVHFWFNVLDLSAMKMTPPVRFSKVVAVPTPLVGWSCRTSEIRQLSDKRSGIFQSADLTCSSAVGTVNVSVNCTLSSDDQLHTSDFSVHDAAGHTVNLNLGCSNLNN